VSSSTAPCSSLPDKAFILSASKASESKTGPEWHSQHFPLPKNKRATYFSVEVIAAASHFSQL